MADFSAAMAMPQQDIPVIMPVADIRSNLSSSSKDMGPLRVPSGHSDEAMLIDEMATEPDEDLSQEVQSQASSTAAPKRKLKKKIHKLNFLPPQLLLEKYYDSAKAREEAKDVDSAIEDTIRCTALARIVHGDGHWKLAESYSILASRYLELKGYFTQAQFHAERARDVMLGAVQTAASHDDKVAIYAVLFDVYCTLGAAFDGLCRYGDAERSLQKAEKVLTERSRLQRSGSTVSNGDIEAMHIRLPMLQGRLAANQGKAAPAAAYFEKAIGLIEEQEGKDTVKLIPLYEALGKVEQMAGASANHEKAITAYLQAHSIAAANYGDGSAELADTSWTLATAYSCMGEEGETSAESYLTQSLATYQTLFGPSDARVLGCQDELARLMIRTGHTDEALRLLTSTLCARCDTFGDWSDDVADTYRLIGSLHMSEVRPELSLPAFKKCLDIETTLYGPNHKKTKEAQKMVDMLMSNPSVAAKLHKSKGDRLHGRPRFNAIGATNTAPPGGCRPVL